LDVYGFVWFLILGFFVALIMSFIIAPLLVKAKKARDIPTEIFDVFETVSEGFGFKDKKPKLMVVDAPEVNAIAYYSVFGPIVAVTRGLIQSYSDGNLSVEELKGIFAHEIAHLKSKHPIKTGLATSIISITDIFSSALLVAASIYGATSLVADEETSYTMLLTASIALVLGGILKILSKIASIIAFHYVRTTEYEADIKAAKTVGKEAVINMLTKIEEINSKIESETKLFMPEKWTLPTRKRSWYEKLFDTHPPTKKRIKKIMEKV